MDEWTTAGIALLLLLLLLLITGIGKGTVGEPNTTDERCISVSSTSICRTAGTPLGVGKRMGWAVLETAEVSVVL